MTVFPISGVETYWWIPIAVAALISTITSIGGLSGAFLLLPFQMSVLGFTSPAVSATNLLFNVVAIPSGVYRYIREKRMIWSLTMVISFGTLPGVLAGVIIRIHLLPDPSLFKLFVGAVLTYISFRLSKDIRSTIGTKQTLTQGEFIVQDELLTFRFILFTFQGQYFKVSTIGVSLLSLIVGIIGGTYGIGGGAIIAPFLVAIFRLPIHTIAGASLMATFVTSVAGVAFYAGFGHHFSTNGFNVAPDWSLGLLFGVGGAIGMYAGARLQRHLKPLWIKKVLLFCLIIVIIKYILEFLKIGT